MKLIAFLLARDHRDVRTPDHGDAPRLLDVRLVVDCRRLDPRVADALEVRVPERVQNKIGFALIVEGVGLTS